MDENDLGDFHRKWQEQNRALGIESFGRNFFDKKEQKKLKW